MLEETIFVTRNRTVISGAISWVAKTMKSHMLQLFVRPGVEARMIFEDGRKTFCNQHNEVQSLACGTADVTSFITELEVTGLN